MSEVDAYSEPERWDLHVEVPELAELAKPCISLSLLQSAL